VERVGGIPAVRARIGERTDHVEELDDRARPSMRDDHREGVGLGRALVDEVDVGAVDGGEEVVELVQPGLGGAPVVRVAPVRDEVPCVSELGAVVPPRIGDLLGEPRAREALLQVVEGRLRDLDEERSYGDLLGHPFRSFIVDHPLGSGWNCAPCATGVRPS
jgi:hypothetical protein